MSYSPMLVAADVDYYAGRARFAPRRPVSSRVLSLALSGWRVLCLPGLAIEGAKVIP